MTADEELSVGENGLSIVGDGCFSWQISLDGNSLQLVAVPEPTTLALLTAAAVMLVGFRRRKR